MDTRKVRIRGKYQVAEVVAWGFWADDYPIRKWTPFNRKTAKNRGVQVGAGGWPDRMNPNPIIKVDNRYYSGEYDYYQKKPKAH